jgi:protein-tyrosine phosphatase
VSALGLRIDLPGTLNLRDIGGYQTGDGQRVRRRMVYRSDAPEVPELDPALPILRVYAAYRQLGIASIVDLRAPSERHDERYSWGSLTGVSDVACFPLLEGGDGANLLMKSLASGDIQSFSPRDLGNLYISSLQRNALVFGNIIRHIAKASKATVIHCVAGKDRTGVVVALLLGALGVPREEVLSDYGLTNVYRPDRLRVHQPMLQSLGIEPNSVAALFEAPVQALEHMLDYVESDFGSATNYLIRAGRLTPQELEELRSSFLEPASNAQATNKLSVSQRSDG